MTTETKVLLGIGVFTVGIMLAGIFLINKPATTSSDLTTSPTVAPSILIRKDSFQTNKNNTQVTVVEFGDFQCPACAAAQPTVNRLKEEYNRMVNFVYRHYPLPQHKNAYKAALAAEAAGEQGKFWEMHDVLFENQNEWSESDNPVEIFLNYAGDLELNKDQFKEAIETEKFKQKILTDEQDGGVARIRYTPTFFIKGHIVEGAASYDILKKSIDTFLKK